MQVQQGGVHVLGENCPRSDPYVAHIEIEIEIEMVYYTNCCDMQYIVCNDLFL